MRLPIQSYFYLFPLFPPLRFPNSEPITTSANPFSKFFRKQKRNLFFWATALQMVQNGQNCCKTIMQSTGYQWRYEWRSAQSPVSGYQVATVQSFLLIGINDLSKNISPDTVFVNIVKIVSTITKKSPKTKVYVQSIFPVNNTFKTFSSHTSRTPQVKDINERLRSICPKLGATYVDLFSVLKNPNDDLLNPMYTNDGLHLFGWRLQGLGQGDKCLICEDLFDGMGYMAKWQLSPTLASFFQQ